MGPETQWLWSRRYVRVFFKDLTEPDPLETVVAFVSNVVTRAARLLNICSIFVIFPSHSHEATVLGKRWDAIFEPAYVLNEHSGNFATCTNISLIFSSIVLARHPVPSRSGREPSGEPTFEGEAGSITRTCHENRWETTKTLGQGKTRSAREREKHRARSNRIWFMSQNGCGSPQVLNPPFDLFQRFHHNKHVVTKTQIGYAVSFFVTQFDAQALLVPSLNVSFSIAD